MRFALIMATLLFCQDALSLDFLNLGKSQVASRAKTQMIGMTKGELFVCAGVPDSIREIDDYDFFTYTTHVKSSTSTTNSSIGSTTRSSNRYCEATFVLKAGQIESIVYKGDTGGSLNKDYMCAFIVKDCLKRSR